MSLQIGSITLTILSDQIVATLLIILVMLLKLLINNQATKIQIKTLVVSIPSEVVVLCIGFLFSANISRSMGSTAQSNDKISILIPVALILVVCLYAAERALDGKLSGNWNWKIWISVIVMYVFSIMFYLYVVFGGVL